MALQQHLPGAAPGRHPSFMRQLPLATSACLPPSLFSPAVGTGITPTRAPLTRILSPHRGVHTTAAVAAPEAPPDVAQQELAKPTSARRRASKSSASPKPSPSPSPPSLKKVPGVGPQNLKLFAAQGLTTVDQLHSLHEHQNSANPETTKAYIQDVVGIRNKGHVSMIIDYLSQQSTVRPASQQWQQRVFSLGHQPKLTLSLEGNISAGKSTFLQILKETGLDQQMQVIPEPVHKWQSVGKQKVNLLQEFYQAPHRYAYTFQNYVFLTRMMQERESYSASTSRLLERSVFCDRMVFVRSVHQSKFMSDTELAIYDSWFDAMLVTLPTLVPNGFIYLRADPETCLRRLKKRDRSEERGVTLEYLQGLHALHEEWLWSGGVKASASTLLHIPSSGQTLVNNNPSLLDPSSPPPSGAQALNLSGPGQLQYSVPPVPSALEDSLFILDSQKHECMLPQLNQIPALVINCNDDVDIERDLQYRHHVSAQVQLYKQYVKAFMNAKADAHIQGLDQPFNGYFLRDSQGHFQYTSPMWHTLSHSTKEQVMRQSRS